MTYGLFRPGGFFPGGGGGGGSASSSLEVVSVSFNGAAGDGVTDDYASIAATVATIGATEQTLYFGPGTYYIGTSLSIPVNIRVRFDKGAIIQDNGDAGVVFTVADPGGIDAGPYQIFNFTGAGSGVTFTNGGKGYINWWCDNGVGTSGDPWTSNSDSMAGMESAIEAGLNDVHLTTGWYEASSTYISTKTNIKIQGEGRGSSVYSYTSTGAVNILEFPNNGLFINDWQLRGPGTGGSETALYFGAGVTGAHCHLKNFLCRDVGDTAFAIDGYYVSLQGCYLFNSGNKLIDLIGSGGVVTIEGASYLNTATYGVYFTGTAVSFGMANCNVENCTYGLYGAGATASPKDLPLRNVHFENNAISDIRLGTGTRTAFYDTCGFSSNNTGLRITTTGGAFQVGDVLTIGGGAATGTISSITGDVYRLNTVTNEEAITVGAGITAAPSGATGTVSAVNIALDLNGASNCTTNLSGGFFDSGCTQQIKYQGKLNVILDPRGFDYQKVERGTTSKNSSLADRQGIRENTGSTSGTGEDDLKSATIPQYSYSVNSLIRVRAGGAKTGTNGNKTLKFYWGSDTPLTFHPAANDEIDWQFEATIQMYDKDTHRCIWKGFHVSITHGYTIFNDDLDLGDIEIKITGECADAGDVINCQYFEVEIL
jgi:hypothetical protein